MNSSTSSEEPHAVQTPNAKWVQRMAWYLAIAFRKYDFRFPIWPLVLLAVTQPIFTAIRAIDVPREFIGHKAMFAGGLPMLFALMAWSAILIYLMTSRPLRSIAASDV